MLTHFTCITADRGHNNYNTYCMTFGFIHIKDKNENIKLSKFVRF